MDILFIHQNFPGQFLHLAPALAAAGHRCVALTLRVKEPTTWRGVRVIPYKINKPTQEGVHPWILSFDSKITRGEACFQGARKLREQGFMPDVVFAHPGWGEAQFLKDVWPEAKLLLYNELYYRTDYPHTGFDPEFEPEDAVVDRIQLRMKNLYSDILFPMADAGLSPTHFQADTHPEQYRRRITVIHDGVDTDVAKPNPDAKLTLPNGNVVTREDEVITFINRNLEPYRGYHVFMRALPELLATRPKAQIVIIGGDEVSYGAAPKGGKSWKQIFIDEVRDQISDKDWARVHFLGRVPYETYLSVVQVSRVHVYLTYPFVLSWSLLESMAMGAAIVASNTPPVREVIKDGKTGTLVDFFDREAFVKAINALADDEERRKAYGEAARNHIVETYDLKSICLPAQMRWLEAVSQKA